MHSDRTDEIYNAKRPYYSASSGPRWKSGGGNCCSTNKVHRHMHSHKQSNKGRFALPRSTSMWQPAHSNRDNPSDSFAAAGKTIIAIYRAPEPRVKNPQTNTLKKRRAANMCRSLFI